MAKSILLGSLASGLGFVAAVGLTKRTKLLRSLGVGALRSPRLPAAAAVGAPQTGLSVLPSKYPAVRRDPSVVENLHGVMVADPYRALEDPDSEETKQFVEDQLALTNEVLAQCDTRPQFKELFTKMYDYAKFGTPFKCGKRYYYYYNSGLQQHYVMYSMDKLGGEPVVVLDPNTFSKDGTISLSSTAFSDDGTFMAYSTSSGGSDWTEIQVISIDQTSGATTKLADKLEYVKYSSMSWTHDNKGFFYNRYDKPKVDDLGTETDSATNQQLRYHVVGTPQEEDVLIMLPPSDHPDWMAGAGVTDDGRFLQLSVNEGCQPSNRFYYVDMEELKERLPDGTVDWKAYDLKKGRTKLPIVKLVDDFTAYYSPVANEGTRFVFRTNLDAPRYRLVAVDVSKPGPPVWEDLVPQHPKDVLKSAVAVKGDNLIIRYLKDVRGVLQLHSLATGAFVRDLPLPGVGNVTGFSGDRKYYEGFFSFTSFVEPGATYRLDLSKADAAPELFRRTELRVPHDPEDYVTKQVFVPSRDGVRIPMFITHHKKTVLNGSAPTLLYAYGGFNIALEPGFSASRLAFMRGYGGVFAQANLRGGGEYGTAWRDAGSTCNKQNVFNDFQACAEFLHAAGYCSPSTLTIQGGSNGGLLVAACCNQRPDLYACVLGQVGVMDMLRFHKFTIGHAWMTDYGNPDKAEDFEYLLPYSPLHNVRPPKDGGQYPAVLLATGDHDDRVVPLHSFKLIAQLQSVLAGSVDSPQRNPLLARIEVRAGHGAGKPTQKVIDETADLYGFAAKCMSAKWVDVAAKASPEAASSAQSAAAPVAVAASSRILI